MRSAAEDLHSGASSSAWLARRGGPLQALDDAMLVLRRAAFGQIARGWLGAIPLGAVVLLLYYLERVEGMRVPRGAFAAVLVLAFWLRFYVLSLLARDFVQVLRPTLPLPAAPPSFASVACSASVSALGLWFWAWPVLSLAQLSAWAVLGAIPLFALRGAVAPSFLARATCAGERGFSAFSRALEDTRGARGVMLGLELLVCVGFLGLFANLYALGALVLVLANSVLGLDVSFLAAFLAPDNEFVTFFLLGVTLLVLEPLRAALSALAFAEARGRNEGADLHAAIDALALDRPAALDERARLFGPVLSLLLLMSSPLHALAQDEGTEQAESAGEGGDAAVRERVKHILARAEFHEFDPASADRFRLSELLERWFGHRSDPDPPPISSPHFHIDVSPWLIVVLGLGLLGLVAAFVLLSEKRRKAGVPRAAPRVQAALQLAAAGTAPDWLAEAAALAGAGRYREALRALYSATLAALGKSQQLRLDKSRTNGDYVRALESGATRERFAAFTDAFERSFYGAEAVAAEDYEQQRRLAELLCEREERA